MGKPQRKIRRSHYISPFGVGAIIDIGGESFIAEDILEWKNIIKKARELHLKDFQSGFMLVNSECQFLDLIFSLNIPPKYPFIVFLGGSFVPSVDI